MTIDTSSNPSPSVVEETTFCYRHPSIETALRCNNCGRFICAKCANRTPVGYRCPECIRARQDVYYTAGSAQYLLAFVVAAAVAVPMIFVLSKILFLAIILGLPGGGLLSEAVYRAMKRKRGRYTWAFVAAGVVVGGLLATVGTWSPLLGYALSGESRALGFLGQAMLYPAIATALVAVTAAARFRYGRG